MLRSFTLAVLAGAFATCANAQTQNTQTPPEAQTKLQAPISAADFPMVSSVRPGGAMILVPGRQLTVAWKIGSPPTQVSEAEAGPNELPAIPDDPALETWTKVAAPSQYRPAQPGQIIFTLWVGDNGTRLLVKSGQEQPIFYMANMIMRRDDKLIAVPTTICAVPANHFGVESWPNQLVGIQIVGIGYISADMCYDHRAKKGYKAGEQPPSMTAQ